MTEFRSTFRPLSRTLHRSRYRASPPAPPPALARRVSAPRWSWAALAAAATLMTGLLLPRPAHAAGNDRRLFTWMGQVDREVYLVVRGRDVQVRGDDAYVSGRVRVTDALPRGVGAVFVQREDGRGEVDIIEQPNARNGYRATIRIRDPRGGADRYRITAYWQGDDRVDDCRAGGRGWVLGRNRSSECPGDRDRDGRNGGWDDRNGRDRDRDRDRAGGWPGNGGTRDGGLLAWSGRVDDVVELRISGRRVDAITRSGVPVQVANVDLRGSGLPPRGVTVDVDRRAGRGAVYVAQQPSAWNGFTAVIRIDDPRGGADFYDLLVRW